MKLKLTITFAALAGVLALGARAGEGGREILNAQSFWRVNIWSSRMPVRLAGGKLDRQPSKIPAPADWAAPGFDDSAWVRMPGPFFPSKYMAGWGGWSTSNRSSTALICLRGRFVVTDPASAGSLKLDLAYRGGAVVYVNGKEVARKNMPEGKLEPHTLAEYYPKECFVRPDGKVIRHAYGDPKRCKQGVALRRRKLSSLSIAAKSLRKGVNILAVELHRAPYDVAAARKDKQGNYRPKGGRSYKNHLNTWATVGMIRLSLKASGSGVRPNVTRPPGFQVWNADPLLVTYDTDYGDAGVNPSTVKIKGARNGRYSGILVAGSDKPIAGLKATVSDLIAEKGSAKIPSSAVEIRYQQAGGLAQYGYQRLPGGQSRLTRVTCMEALSPVAPETVAVRKKDLKGKQNVVFGAVCPVWLTVHVPEDAAAGLYRGECIIKASGAKPVKTALVLEVLDWTLPPAHKFRTAAGFHQSPESVALHYKVAFWSDEHFKLLGESYKWLGSIGCKTVFVHLIERTNLGNEQSILRWKRRKSAGPAPATNGKGLPKITLATHQPDFTALDRYLDVALKHLVEPPVICLYAWDNYCGTAYSGSAGSKHNVKPGPARITELLPGGKTRSAEGPNYKNMAEAAAFWKPVAEHVRAYLKKRRLEKSLMIGLAHDSWPGKFVVDTWKKLLPSAPWAFEGHPRPEAMYGVPVQWCCTVWCASWNPPRNLKHGWQLPKIQCHFDRDNWRLDAQSQLLSNGHLAGEKNIIGNQRGFGRMSADLWPVLKNAVRTGRSTRSFSISARYPESDWGACNLRQTPFLQPGPKGAISTGRFEMIREGLQESEARIFIESALISKRAGLGADLVKRCERLLKLRRSLVHSAGSIGVVRFLATGRQARVRELFKLAGEVAVRTGMKK
jgi:Glycoside hydrolase 123 N-terminal domain/Glycoside hydrolase 123, catalytic domain